MNREEKLATFQELTKHPGIKTGRQFEESILRFNFYECLSSHR